MKKWVVLKKKNISIWDEEWRSKSEKEIEKDLEKEMDIRTDVLKARDHLLHNKFEESIPRRMKGPRPITMFDDYLNFLEKGIKP